jgi:hypothetical protein
MTTKSREAFQEGLARASRFGNPELQPEHLLSAMLEPAPTSRRSAQPLPSRWRDCLV